MERDGQNVVVALVNPLIKQGVEVRSMEGVIRFVRRSDGDVIAVVVGLEERILVPWVNVAGISDPTRDEESVPVP